MAPSCGLHIYCTCVHQTWNITFYVIPTSHTWGRSDRMVVTGLKGNQYQEQSIRKLGFALFFLFIWEQRARHCFSNLRHALLEVSQMSGIIIELHHDRVLRGRIPRVCTALGMGEGMQKLFDRKWDHFSVTSAAFCGWSHLKPGCPKIRLPAPTTDRAHLNLCWLSS